MATEPHTAAGSPLDRLRQKTARQRREVVEHFDVPGYDGALVARVGLIEDGDAATSALRFFTDFAGGDMSEIRSDALNDAATVIASATVSLWAREDGELVAINDESGMPLRFDHRYGAAIGEPEIVTGMGAVFAAFTEGDPPRVNALKLMVFALSVAGWCAGTDASEQIASGL